MVPSREDRKDQTKPRGKAEKNRTASLALAAVTALVIAALAIFAVLSTTGSGGSNGVAGNFTPNDQGLLQPGGKAPSFSAEGVAGGEVSLSEGGGEATLLVFFATWCPHCNNEAPILSELAQENENLHVIMAGIDGQDNPKKVKQFVQEYGIRGEALYQPSLGETYQVNGYPTSYVIDEQGQIVGANAGETPKHVLREWIEEANS